jgi:hypothetical protein
VVYGQRVGALSEGATSGHAQFLRTGSGCCLTPYVRVVGYLRGRRPSWVDCERPLLRVCGFCEAQSVLPCSGHRESQCRPCAARYRRRVSKVVFSGVNGNQGHLYLLTLTAPSEKGAHCKKPRCRGSGRSTCGHETCPCTPEGGVDLAAWNADHSRRWNQFRTALKRLFPDLQFFRGVEVQDGHRGGTARGALHDHCMVRTSSPLVLRQLRALAISCGFGHSVDLAGCAPGSKQAAYYVAKYVTKATDSRRAVPWVNVETGELTDGRYRTWSMSREWGLKMAEVRAADAAAAAGRAADADARAERLALDLVAVVLGGEVEEDPPPDDG